MSLRKFAAIALTTAILPLTAGLVLASEQNVSVETPATVTTPKVSAVGTVNAMLIETVGRATDLRQVHAQGGFAVAGAVRWTTGPAEAAALPSQYAAINH
ncbi:hypothetical protein [Paracoccus sulfuroxidans]|uniref:Secreted protein n=1 Tax=Paracoccus sulfuroxidans TaxID=384678 RepID=A0A562NP13_9RHOB|nr:hypothetical protein [Paracoccus sulfuroxidans]TWI33935.1 hypothetical protein IQ24_02302 [Paracoccus sulfuroxidans]